MIMARLIDIKGFWDMNGRDMWNGKILLYDDDDYELPFK